MEEYPKSEEVKPKTKRLILRELYKLKEGEKINIYEIADKIGKTYSGVYRHIKSLKDGEMVEIDKVERGEEVEKNKIAERPECNVKLTPKGKEIVRLAFDELKKELTIFMVSNKNLFELKLLGNMKFQKLLRRMKEFELIDGFELKPTKEGKEFLGL